MKHILKPLIYVIGALLVSWIAFSAVKYRYSVTDSVSVTGLGEQEFVSDIIVWSATINATSTTLKGGYEEIERSRTLVKKYLSDKNIPDSCITYLSIASYANNEPTYINGNYSGTRQNGFNMSQKIRIESRNVELVEKVSRDISDLISQNVNINSEAPQYYYSKLEDLKLSLVASATANARERAEKIAEKAGAKLSNLASSRMGVFQITGTYSGEDYSWGGTYNTSSKKKKASITIKLDYRLN